MITLTIPGRLAAWQRVTQRAYTTEGRHIPARDTERNKSEKEAIGWVAKAERVVCVTAPELL